MRQSAKRNNFQSNTLSLKVLSQLWIPVVLFLSLMLIVLGLLSQQFDTRQRAQTSNNYCWNKMHNYNGTATWPSPCAKTPTDIECSAVLSNATCDEVKSFNMWVDSTCPPDTIPTACGTLEANFSCTKMPLPNGCSDVGTAPIPCVKNAPEITFDSISNSSHGTAVTFNGKVTNKNSSDCSANENITLTFTKPNADWSVSADNTNFSLANNASAIFTLTVMPPISATAGDYKITTTANSATKTSTADTTTTVVETLTGHTINLSQSATISLTTAETNGKKVGYTLKKDNQTLSNTDDISIEFNSSNPNIVRVPDACINSPNSCISADITLYPFAVGSSTITITAFKGTTKIASATFTVTVTDPPKKTYTFDIRTKLTGVTTSAYAPEAVVRFVNQATNTDVTSNTVTMTPISSGIFKIFFTASGENLPPGTGYLVYIKGTKQLSKKFCIKPDAGQSKQTTACASNQSITIADTTDVQTFDFTGMPLEPGDVYPQDGRVDTSGASSDLGRVFSQVGLDCDDISLSTAEINTCKAMDLNYDGKVRLSDTILLLQSLSVRYDD